MNEKMPVDESSPNDHHSNYKDGDGTIYIDLDEFDSSMWEHFDINKWEKNKQHYMNHLKRCWGKFPRKVSLKPRIIEESMLDGYKRRKVVINVENSGIRQWDTMPFFILTPEKPIAKPCPVIIIHHQHAGKFDKGKEEPAGMKNDPEQAFAVDLVRRGYITVCHDALCFSERQEISEIFTFRELILMGRTMNLKYAWDVRRLIDYLETLPEVDSNKIGIMGHSLGGQEAIFCAVFDDRIKIAISSCGVAKINGKNSVLEKGITHNTAFYLPGFLTSKIPMDMKEIIGLIYPRPVFLSHGVMDKGFPIEGVAEIDNWIEELYASRGHRDKCMTMRHAGGHYIPKTTKKKAYEFIDKFFKQD
ncbi:MAG: alpha/beta hydrolase family protein [Promethearchaeota archaeon]